MTLKEILKITHGKIISGEKTNKELGKICIDSRKIEKNDIFVAIKGNKTDGNLYINEVLNKASLIITEKKIKTNSKTPILKVFNAKKGSILTKHFIDNYEKFKNSSTVITLVATTLVSASEVAVISITLSPLTLLAVSLPSESIVANSEPLFTSHKTV